jgi:hypothetical protein
VSEMVPYKRLDYAIRLFARIGRPLKIAGGGPDFSRLRKLASGSVEFCGRVSDEELRNLYAGCAAFVMPGEEDFGITMVEALASGKPVIALGHGCAGTDLDAYLLAFLIPSFLTDVLCGAIVPALVPRLIELMQYRTKSAALELYNGTVLRSVSFVSSMAALLALTAGIMLVTHSGDRRTELACRLLLVMLPILPLSALSNVWRGTLNGNRRFAVAAMTSGLHLSS